MDKKISLSTILVRIAQPFLLLGGLLTYTLGLGIVHFLGDPIDWADAILGSTLILFILLAKNFLSAFFTAPEPLPSPSLAREIKGEAPDFVELKEVQHNLLLEIGLVALAAGAGVTYALLVNKAINLPEALALGLAVLLAFLAAVPPFRLERRGYGELIEVLLVCNLFPAIAFLFHEPSINTLLGMLTFPLLFVFLAMQIALSLEYFAYGVKHETGTMVVLMGWQHAMTWHNLSILLAFLLLGAFVVLRLSWILVWPIFLALPLGIFQIVQMQHIANGGRPQWWLLRLNAISTFTLMAYLTALTLWLH